MDGWPQMSDAVVGYYFDKKLAYHYIQRAQAPFAIACDELIDNYIRRYACNDTSSTCPKMAETTISAVSPPFNLEKYYNLFKEYKLDDLGDMYI